MKQLKKIIFLFILCLNIKLKAQDVLIVADEIPAMEALAKAFKNAENWILRVSNTTNPSSFIDTLLTTVYTSEIPPFNFGGNGGVVNFLTYEDYK